MNRYLIYGPNGSGKSAIGDELAKRGYRVIEGDELASWINVKTSQKVEHNPPFTDEWLKKHHWNWNREKLLESLSTDEKPVFLVGGAHNMSEFMDMFEKKFIVTTDYETAIKRLKKREPDRWTSGTAEAKQLKEQFKSFKKQIEEIPKGFVVVHNISDVASAADQIIDQI